MLEGGTGGRIAPGDTCCDGGQDGLPERGGAVFPLVLQKLSAKPSRQNPQIRYQSPRTATSSPRL